MLRFGELGLYHLLCRLRGYDELDEFHKQTLASLAKYDTEHGTQLVPTLEAFFAHHGNVSQAASKLGLHRSNLYRKMRQLGMDTDR